MMPWIYFNTLQEWKERKEKRDRWNKSKKNWWLLNSLLLSTVEYVWNISYFYIKYISYR